MSVNPLNNHYSMNNPASIYDEEALTALQLCGRLAQKVVEIIDLVNKNELTIDEAVEQFAKDYKEAKQYMVDNLPDFVENSVENLKNSGDLETMLVKAIEEKKLDKNSVESITYSMLSQQIKEMFTGGNTPVVSTDSVSTSNMVNNSVIEVKLRRDLHNCEFFATERLDYFKPLLIIDTSAKSAIVNPEFTNSFRINTREKYSIVDPSDLVVNVTGWTSNNPAFYFNPDNNEIRIADGTRSTTYEQYLFLGSFNFYGYGVSTVIPVLVNGQFYMGNHAPTIKQLPLQIRNARYYNNTKHYYEANQAVFDFNFNTNTCTILKTGSINLTTEDFIYAMNLNTVSIEIDPTLSGSHAQVYFNPFTNTLSFVKTANTFSHSFANCLYLGLITKATVSMSSSCILPYTIDGTYYVFPESYERPRADLIMSNTVVPDSPVVAKVDFKNRRMIIPAHTQLTAGLNSNYIHMNNDDLDTDMIIPFGSSDSTHQYLVGGVDGLMFVPYSQFRSISNARNFKQLYYFGYVNETTHDIHLRCKAEKMRTMVVLGDSISTFAGSTPDGHTIYYDGTKGGIDKVEKMWWARVANRCGLKTLINMSWSGIRATPRSNNPNRDALYLAGQTKNYTNGDVDVILLYIGINDFNNNEDIGEWDRKSALDLTYNNVPKQYFMESYAKVVETLKRDHPNAEIYCLTLPNCERDDVIGQSTEVNANGVALWEFNEVIKKVCETLRVNVIDTATCNFNRYNSNLLFADYSSSTEGFLHPNAEGMKVIANKVIKAILDTKECD